MNHVPFQSLTCRILGGLTAFSRICRGSFFFWLCVPFQFGADCRRRKQGFLGRLSVKQCLYMTCNPQKDTLRLKPHHAHVPKTAGQWRQVLLLTPRTPEPHLQGKQAPGKGSEDWIWGRTIHHCHPCQTDPEATQATEAENRPPFCLQEAPFSMGRQSGVVRKTGFRLRQTVYTKLSCLLLFNHRQGIKSEPQFP